MSFLWITGDGCDNGETRWAFARGDAGLEQDRVEAVKDSPFAVAWEIHQELQADLERFIGDPLHDRVREILAASGHLDDDEADVTEIAAASTAAAAEGVLAAVAMYLARHEMNTPT